MKKFAIVSKAAESRLLVVLAHVGREVRHCDGADVGRCLDRADYARRRVGVLLDEVCGVCEALVCPIGSGSAARCPEKVLVGEGIVGVLVVPVTVLGGVIDALDGGVVGGFVFGREQVSAGGRGRGRFGRGCDDAAGVLLAPFDALPGFVGGGGEVRVAVRGWGGSGGSFAEVGFPFRRALFEDGDRLCGCGWLWGFCGICGIHVGNGSVEDVEFRLIAGGGSPWRGAIQM